METQKIMDLNELKGIEGGDSIDLETHDKKEAKIEKAEIVQVKSDYADCKTQWVLKVSSEVLDTLREGDDKIEFRASELFNLIQDKEGKLVGYPEAEGSNLAKFMADLKIKKPNELIGQKVLLKSYKKGERTYLKFRY